MRTVEIKREPHNIETLLSCLLEQVNREATEGTDWTHQVLTQADSQGVLKSFQCVLRKPYFNQHGKKAWSDKDGYTVHFPALTFSYNDRRTEFRFKQNDCKLELFLEKVLSRAKEVIHS